MASTRGRAIGFVQSLLVGTLVGAAIACTVFLSVWYSHGSTVNLRLRQDRANSELNKIRYGLEDYRKTKGKYPGTIAELFPEFNDPWGNPYQYHARNSGFSVSSLGRDGKIGGEGVNADLEIRDTTPSEIHTWRQTSFAAPTLRQFAFESDIRGVWLTSVLSGFFAFLACLVYSKPWAAGAPPWWIRLGLTLAACLVIAMFISAAHIPSNH